MADAESGEVLLADRDDEIVFTASTAEGLPGRLGLCNARPDATLTTPVYATTPVVDGAVAGDMVLVACDDMALSGRDADNGAFDTPSTPTWSITCTATWRERRPHRRPADGPRRPGPQIAEQGVTRVDGDVLIDASVWDPFDGARVRRRRSL